MLQSTIPIPHRIIRYRSKAQLVKAGWFWGDVDDILKLSRYTYLKVRRSMAQSDPSVAALMVAALGML